MTQPEPPPSDMEALESFLDSQRPDVRELFQYALAMLMVEQGKATFGEETTGAGGRAQVQVMTSSGLSFSVPKPAVTSAMLEQMMAIVRMANDKGNPA